MRVKHSTGLLRVSIKILLLEDDILFGETLVDLLEDAGYEVCYVTNGSDALDATYKAKFDLYLLDINVPFIIYSGLITIIVPSSMNVRILMLFVSIDSNLSISIR